VSWEDCPGLQGRNLLHSRLRCLLHYSLLHSPPYSASSQALLARSVSHIIRGYAKCATDHRYTPSWPDLRRITTCGHLVLLLHDAEEYVRDEAEDLLSFVLKLVAGLKGNCPMAMDALTMLTRLMRLAGESTLLGGAHGDRLRNIRRPACRPFCSSASCRPVPLRLLLPPVVQRLVTRLHFRFHLGRIVRAVMHARLGRHITSSSLD
jgi:hypothetical protein